MGVPAESGIPRTWEPIQNRGCEDLGSQLDVVLDSMLFDERTRAGSSWGESVE